MVAVMTRTEGKDFSSYLDFAFAIFERESRCWLHQTHQLMRDAHSHHLLPNILITPTITDMNDST